MLRSIKKAFDIIKAEDAETAITVHTIRTWCKQGKIKCLTAGNKILVDMQSLLDYIAIKKRQYGGIIWHIIKSQKIKKAI